MGSLRSSNMIKKVVIAAAGQGTRMKHLSENKSKHLIGVQDKPFLAYLLDNLLAAGYDDFILVTGFRADLMEEFLKEYGYKAKLVNQFEILGPKEKEYGTLCPLKCVKDLVGDEDFLAIYGDNIFSVRDLKSFQDLEHDLHYIAARTEEHPENYGVLKTDGEYLKEIVEKPQQYIDNLVNCGLYKFTSEIFDKITYVGLSPRGEYELTDAVSLLAKEGRVKVKQIKDYWLDFGRPDDVDKMAKLLQEVKLADEGKN